jgi:hypothetical protein
MSSSRANAAAGSRGSWVDPLLDRRLADEVGDHRVRQLVDVRGRLNRLLPQRVGDLLLEDPFRLLGCHLVVAAEEELRIEIPLDQVDVGYRRFLAPASVTDRAGV